MNIPFWLIIYDVPILWRASDDDLSVTIRFVSRAACGSTTHGPLLPAPGEIIFCFAAIISVSFVCLFVCFFFIYSSKMIITCLTWNKCCTVVSSAKKSLFLDSCDDSHRPTKYRDVAFGHLTANLSLNSGKYTTVERWMALSSYLNLSVGCRCLLS